MWLIAEHIAHEIRAARAAHPVASTQDRALFARVLEATQAARDSGPRSLTVAGDTAEIRIQGVLTEQPDFWLWLFGIENTAYEDIRAAISAAESDASIRKVVFYFDSGGGNVDGMFETIAAMQAMTKPSSVRARMACSAAYALAAVGGKIEAVNYSSTFGSVGVVATYRISEDIVEITNTDSPNKRPDPTDPAGKTEIRKYLDALYDLTLEAVASGRGTTVEAVNDGHGRGAVMLSAEAKKLGLIDKIAGARPGANGARACAPSEQPETVPAPPVATETSLTNATGKNGAQERPMDLKTLRAQHPELCDELVAEGTAREHKRVCAHLKMAKRAGCVDIAHTAIADKKAFDDEEVQADYLSASMDARDARARTDDEAVVAGAVVGATPTNAGTSFADQVAAEMAARKKGK